MSLTSEPTLLIILMHLPQNLQVSQNYWAIHWKHVKITEKNTLGPTFWVRNFRILPSSSPQPAPPSTSLCQCVIILAKTNFSFPVLTKPCQFNLHSMAGPMMAPFLPRGAEASHHNHWDHKLQHRIHCPAIHYLGDAGPVIYPTRPQIPHVETKDNKNCP